MSRRSPLGAMPTTLEASMFSLLAHHARYSGPSRTRPASTSAPSRSSFLRLMRPKRSRRYEIQTSLPGFWRFTQGRLRSPAQGADTVIWLAAADEPGRSSGQFWFDRRARSPYLVPGTRERPADRAALWELCVRATAPAVEAPA